jgi:two-component system, NtrC family, sensor histidine kinase HydH
MPPVPGAGLPFKLLRWFSVAGFALVAAFAAANALLLSGFLTKHLLQREAQITGDFVRNILLTDGTVEYLADPRNPELRTRFLESTKHFTATRDILRTNVYARDGTVLWSTDKSLVGKRFEHNEELEEALKGELAVESGGISKEARMKPEHVGLPVDSKYFIETYIPITRAGGGEVVGVVETYKAPVALTEAIHAGYRQVWLTAGIGALALYLTLFWIVRRADHTIRRQHARLIETETMAAAGELTSSMAHNIRNPLASIRSSAELSIELRGEDNEQQARDIIGAVDRIEGWIRELLRYTKDDADVHAQVDVGAMLAAAFTEHARQFERRGLAGSVIDMPASAMVSGDAPVLAQVLHSLITNAIDATPSGGRVDGRIERKDRDWISVSIVDTGVGIAPEHMESIFRPFFTTKKEGLGLGLSLVRRSIERMGGRIHVRSSPGTGTVVSLELPAS